MFFGIQTPWLTTTTSWTRMEGFVRWAYTTFSMMIQPWLCNQEFSERRMIKLIKSFIRNCNSQQGWLLESWQIGQKFQETCPIYRTWTLVITFFFLESSLFWARTKSVFTVFKCKYFSWHDEPWFCSFQKIVWKSVKCSCLEWTHGNISSQITWN